MWTKESIKALPVKNGYSLRGLDMTRLETFTDASFAFAVTLLIISSGSIPKSYSEFVIALKDIPAFAASFLLFAFLWIGHRSWSRRFGLEDRYSTLLSLVLVFTVLVYVYPLKLICSMLFSWLSNGVLPATFLISTQQEVTSIFVIYGLGYSVLMAVYSLLYRHALQLKGELVLSELEQKKTRSEMILYAVLSLTGFTSALFALIMPEGIGIFAGFFYTTLPITMPLTARRLKRGKASKH